MTSFASQEHIEKSMVYRPLTAAMGNSFVEAVLGIGAITLAIIGLAHAASIVLLSVATIIVSAALLFEEGAIAERYAAASYENRQPFNKFMRRLGMSGLFICATSATALGVLSLLGFVPMILVPIAVMVLGASLMIVSAVNERLNAMEISVAKTDRTVQEAGRETVIPSSSGVELFVGIAAVTLGVLSLSGVSPMVLSFAAIISIGTAQLLNGSVMTRMLNLFRHRHTASHSDTVEYTEYPEQQ
jgi:hypothetical protein